MTHLQRIPRQHIYSLGLDFMRIIAASLVVLTHLRAALFVDWQQSESRGLVARLFYSVTSLGSEAVVVFFVLSGFLVGGSLLKGGGARLFSWKLYLSSRLVRLWIVLVPALLLSAILSIVSPVEFLSGGFRAAWSSRPIAGDGSCSPFFWLGNLFFLQKIFVPVFCNNGPLWSLAYEFWYYILFPLLLFGFRDRHFILIALAVIIASFIGLSVLQGFVFWLIGVGTFTLAEHSASLPVPTPEKLKLLYGLLGFLLLPAALLVGKLYLIPSSSLFQASLALAIACAFLVASWSPVLISPKSVKAYFLDGFWRRMSESTFSLYVLHFPLICALVPRIAPMQNTNLNLVAIVQFFGLFALCLICAIGFAALTEWRTPVIRRWVLSQLKLA